MCFKSTLSRLVSGCVLTVLLIGGEARADVELDVQNNSKTINPAKTLTWTHQCSGDNRILLVGAANRNNNSVTAVAVTYNGINLTKLASHDNGSLHHSVWALLNPPTNGNFNVTVFLDNSNPAHTREIAAGSLSVKNAQQLLPTIGNGRVFTATGSSTSPAVNVNGMIVGGLAFNSIGAIQDPVVASANAPQLEQWNIQTSGSPANNQILNGGGTRQNVSGVVPMNWTLAASKSWASIGVRIAAVPPTVTSAANQVFVVGDSPTTAANITIQDNGAVIDATTDIRIRIPSTFNMVWDTSVLSFAAGGTASLKVNAGNVGYEDGGKTAVIDVISDMSVQDSLIISGLKFKTFTPGSSPNPDNLDLEVKNDGTISATDSATIEIRAPSIAYNDATTTFVAGSAPSPAAGINNIVVQGNVNSILITAANDIRIRIPAALNMTWDTTANMPTLTPSGDMTVAPTVTFENNNKTVVIDVLTAATTAGQTLTITGLKFANFNARSGPAPLRLDIRNNGGTSASSVAMLNIRGPLMSSAADQQFVLLSPSDAAISTITIMADPVAAITAANDIRVRIPNGFDMFWDNSVTMAGIGTITVAGGTGTIDPINVTYSPDNKSLILNVLTDFTGNEVVTINNSSGLEYTGFFTQSGLDNLELVIDGNNSGRVAAFDSRTIVISGAQIASIGAGLGQTFNTGAPSTLADTVRITENANATTITPANDIRIRIPAGVDLLWDQTVTMAASMSGTAVSNGRVIAGQTLAYEDGGRTLVIEVANNFAPGEILNITGLKYTSFGASSQDFLELDTLDDPTKVGATDPRFLRVVAPTLSSQADQSFPVGSSSSPASLITITEDARVQTITMANDIRIRIPGSVDMVWDTAFNMPTFGGTAMAKVNGTVTFEDANKVVVIDVTAAGFALGDTLTVAGLRLKNFLTSTPVPDNLELVTTGNFANPTNATDDKTKAITGVNDPPSFSTTGNVNVLGSTGPNSIPGWLNGIGPGAGETGQTVSFMISNDNNALFSVQPNIIAGAPIGPNSYPDQNLTFTLAPGKFGVANITITAMDNGGTANGGNDTSAPITLKITVFEAVTTIHNKSQGAVTTATVNSYSHTVPAGENRAIYAGVGWHDTAGEVVTSVTYNGLPLALQGAGVQVNDGSETMSNRMYARALGTGAAITANVVVTVNNNTFISSGAVSMCGVNQAAVITGVGGVTGDSKTPNAVFTGVTPDQVIVDSVAVTRSPFPTPPNSIAPTVAAQTEQWDVTSTASGSFQDHVLAAGSTRSNGNGSVTNRWLLNTTTSRIWSIIAGKVGGSGFIMMSSPTQSLEIGETGVPASTITITETTGTPQIKAANDIRIRIPAGLDITWDTTVPLGSLSFGGTYGGSVTAVSYSGDMKTVILDINTDFTDGQTITINGLVFNAGAMASGPDNLELVTSGVNTDPAITEDDMTKNVIRPLTISSAANQSFVVNDNPTAIEVITITEHETTPEMLAGNTLCIDIPVGVDMTWDTTSSPTFGGSGFMNVTGPAVFSNGDRRMCVNITTSFSPSQTLTISGLNFKNFNSGSGPANLTLDVDGNASVDVAATDDKTKTIGAPSIASAVNQTFLVSDGVTVASQITITEDANVVTLTDANEIRIQIPSTLDMEWDTSNLTPVFSGTYSGMVTSVTYPDNKTMLISIDSDFGLGETLIVNNATFANFGENSTVNPDNLELVASGAGGPVAATDPQTKTILQPSITSTVNQQFAVGSMNQSVDLITITDDLIAGTIIANDANGDIRIKIPGTLSMIWDTTITMPTFNVAGLTTGAISPTVTYEDGGKTLVVNVTMNFSAGDSFTIAGLEFENLALGGGPDSLEMEIRNNGISQTEDPFTKEILAPTISSAANQDIPINSADQIASTITITEVMTGTPLITAANDLYVRIPASLDMEFVDPPAGGVTASGTAVPGKVAAAPAIVYVNDAFGKKRIACIPVSADFALGDTLILMGFEFTGFGTVTGPDNLELIIDGNPLGVTVAEDDKFKRTSAATLSSAADQFFLAGTGITPISPITITEHPSAVTITTAGDIVIDIPAGLDMTWDTTDFTALFGGTFIMNGGTIGAITGASYTMGGKRLTLTVSRDFAAGETLTIADLGFNVGTTPSALDKLELSVDGGVSVADEDDKNKSIGAPTLSSASGSEFNVGDPPTALPTITITESAGPTITAANEIVIRLPAGFNGEFDTTKLLPTFGGTAASKVSTVNYPNATTLVVQVTTDFEGNDTLTLDGLCLRNFTANSPADNMELYVGGLADVTVDAFDDKFIAIGQMVFVGGSACYSDGVLANMSTFNNFMIGGENNRILVAGISVYDADNVAHADVIGVTYNGVAMTQGPEITVASKGVVLDGTGDRVTVADPGVGSALDQPGDFTIEARINVSPVNGALQFIASKSAGGNDRNYQFRIRANDGTFPNSLELVVADSTASSIFSYRSTTPITLGAEIHVAVRYQAGGGVTFFQNGAALVTGGSGTFPNPVRVNNAPVIIGNAVLGAVSEVRLWSDFRTNGEIAANFNTTLTGGEANLAGYWKMDEGFGTAANDATANNNNGTLQFDAAYNNPPFMRSEIWHMLEASLPAAGMYDFDITTAGTTDERFLHASYIYNAKQTGTIPESTATGGSGAGVTPFSTSITTMNDMAWIFDTIGFGAVTMGTEGGGQTEVCDTQEAAASSAASYKELMTAGMTTMSWSGFTAGAPTAHAVAAFAPFVVNQPPTLTQVLPMVTFLENTVNATPQIIDAAVTLTDIDSADFDGGNLTVNYSVGGGAEDQLAFDATGDFTLVGTSVRYMGVEIGTVPAAGPGSGINGASLVITFDADATLAIVELLIEALTYGNTSDTPTASRTIQITVDDGDGGVSAPTSTIIAVTPENDRPTLTMVNTLMSAQEDTPYTITYAALLAASNANDPDGDTLMFRIRSITTGTLVHVDAGMTTTAIFPGFTLLGVGESLVWTAPLNENNVSESGPHDAFRVIVYDGSLNSALPDVNVPINVIPCNDPPTFLRGGDRTATAGIAVVNEAWLLPVNTSPGPMDESAQTVSYVLTTDNDPFFSVLPTVNAAGQITYTIAAGMSGFARVSIVAVDSGPNGGCDVNTSAAQNFVISTSVHFKRCGPIIATAGGPADLILLDVGGNDGKRDFIVADMTADSLGIWLGNGNSAFTQLGTFPLAAGAMPVALAMNDFNRDGNDDFAVANFGNNDVTIFRGSIGSPVIRLTGTIAVGTAPMDIITGDFTGDGRADIVTANSGSANISLLVNQGNMAFAAAANTAVGNSPSGVTAGDYNGDGNLDLAVANFADDTVTILLGDGAGGFAPAAGSPIAVGNEPIAIEGARDLNGDGRLDLAVCNFNGGLAGGTISLFLGNGAGGFAAAAGSPIAVADGPRAINLRDIDVDGDFDMVVMNNGVARDSATLMFNNGSAGFAMTESIYTGTDPVGLVIGNLNGPNNGNDMAICNFTDGTVQVLCYVAPRALPFPNSTDRSLDVLEDSMVTFEAIGEVLTQEPLNFTLVTAPLNGMLTGVIPNLTYTPDPDYFGTDTFSFRVTSTTSGLSSATATVTIWVQSVNDEPSMTIATPSSSAASGAGPQTIVNFATNIMKDATPTVGSVPPWDESGQKIGIQVTPHQTWNKDLFLQQPNIDATGTLSYTPRPGQSGSTTIKFRVVDNQGIGTNFGGDPIGNEVTVTFTITP